jgi:hypothetical protein
LDLRTICCHRFDRTHRATEKFVCRPNRTARGWRVGRVSGVTLLEQDEDMNALGLRIDPRDSRRAVDPFPCADDEAEHVVADSEWRIISGSGTLAALLDMDVCDIRRTPVGAFIHVDDLTHSPLELWRTGGERVLRFRHRTDGYVRIQLSVSRYQPLPECWSLQLCGVDADVVEMTRGETSFGSGAQQGETRSTEELSTV